MAGATRSTVREAETLIRELDVSLDARFESIATANARSAKLEESLDSQFAMLGSRFSSMDSRFEKLESFIMDHQREITATKLDLFNTLQKMEERFQSTEGKVFPETIHGGNSGHSDWGLKPYSAVTRLGKVEFPRFAGDKISEWIFKVEQFFELDRTPEDLKVGLISIHLDGEAANWHRSLWQATVPISGIKTWGIYKQLIMDRFEDLWDDPIAVLKHLTETAGIVAYNAKFEELRARVSLSEEYLVRLYLAGLCGQTQAMVRMFKPGTVKECLELGRLYESALEPATLLSPGSATKLNNQTSSGVRSSSSQQKEEPVLFPIKTAATATVQGKPRDVLVPQKNSTGQAKKYLTPEEMSKLQNFLFSSQDEAAFLKSTESSFGSKTVSSFSSSEAESEFHHVNDGEEKSSSNDLSRHETVATKSVGEVEEEEEEEDYVKKKGVSFELEEHTTSFDVESPKISSLSALSVHATRDLREVVKEIKSEFEVASSHGEEVAVLLVVSGVITAIAALASLKVEFEGNGGHVGAVLMLYRNDAGLAAAELASAIAKQSRNSLRSNIMWDPGGFQSQESLIQPAVPLLVFSPWDPGISFDTAEVAEVFCLNLEVKVSQTREI